MDLLFSKYASPFILLEQMVELGRLAEFVIELLISDNNKKLWELYLSCVSNPMNEVGSFEDFKKKCNKSSQAVSETELEATVKNSNNILNNFNPT